MDIGTINRSDSAAGRSEVVLKHASGSTRLGPPLSRCRNVNKKYKMKSDSRTMVDFLPSTRDTS
jgi:hypothetical protein